LEEGGRGASASAAMITYHPATDALPSGAKNVLVIGLKEELCKHLAAWTPSGEGAVLSKMASSLSPSMDYSSAKETYFE
ncbi:unnamed protein product, partial [Chrysoparadoxa australica]